MTGWHNLLNGHEFEQSLGNGEGQGSLVCCSPRGCKESDITERLNSHNILYMGFPGDSVVKNPPGEQS